jgi:hypothetical protein
MGTPLYFVRPTPNATLEAAAGQTTGTLLSTVSSRTTTRRLYYFVGHTAHAHAVYTYACPPLLTSTPPLRLSPPLPLSLRQDHEKAVLSAFVDGFNFEGLDIENALRMFLQAFRLPGEAQKIDRLMEAFAAALFKANPEPFANADAAYTMAFSIIMLNTDLHNPGVVHKMTIEQFISNNRKINGGGDLPRPFLERIYAVIRDDEIKLNDEARRLSRGAWRALAPTGSASAEAATPQLGLPQQLRDPALRSSFFAAVAPHALSALHSSLTRAESRETANHALNGYAACARVASEHGERAIVDAVLTALAAASTLSAAHTARPPLVSSGSSSTGNASSAEGLPSPKGGGVQPAATPNSVAAGGAGEGSVSTGAVAGAGAAAAESVGAPALGGVGGPGVSGTPRSSARLREKSMLAAATLFRVGTECAYVLGAGMAAEGGCSSASVGGGWNALLECLIGLHERGLLPPDICSDPLLGRSWDEEPARAIRERPAVKHQSSFSFTGLVGYLIGATPADDERQKAAEHADAQAKRDVATFGIGSLLDRAASLPLPSLDAFVEALIAAASPPALHDTSNLEMPRTPGGQTAAVAAMPTGGGAASDASATGGGGGDATSDAQPQLAAGASTAKCGTTPSGVAHTSAPDDTSTSTSAPNSPVGLRGGASVGGRFAAEVSPRRRAFVLQLLADVAIRRGASFDHLWSQMQPVLNAAVSDAPPLSRAACIALLRLGLRVRTRADGEVGSGDSSRCVGQALDVALPSLSPYLQLQGVLSPPMVNVVGAALEEIVSPPLPIALKEAAAAAPSSEGAASSEPPAASAIEQEASWRILVALTAAPDILASPPAAAHTLQAVRHLLVGGNLSLGSGVPAGCFASAVSALLAHASAEAPTVEHSLRAIEALTELQGSVRAVAASISSGETPVAALPPLPAAVDLGAAALATDAPWLRVWLPWLRALASLTVASRGAVRDAAVVALQRVLLHPDSGPSGNCSASAAAISAAFECVVFPLLADLLQRSVGGRLDDERLMLRAEKLLSKVFLHHLAALLTLPNFSVLWLRLLELLQSYLHAPNNELLIEAVPETLKNLLLVMATAGAFDGAAGGGDDEQSLATMTKAVIDSWGMPELAPLWQEAVGGDEPVAAGEVPEKMATQTEAEPAAESQPPPEV